MTDEQIKKQSEEYATEIGCDEQTGTETLFISPTKKQAFQDGAKWGYGKALKELLERVEKDQLERQVQTINVIELKAMIKDLGVEL